MRKTIALSFATVLLLSLAGCANEDAGIANLQQENIKMQQSIKEARKIQNQSNQQAIDLGNGN